ncbi:MAG: nucleoside transporter C-terminal domain-containing protein [Crocinitomicaceae bacterium]|nr:nucleoside transporter C-terminal domain-containing protein [Crocinitomicaceae bacterium]
MDRFIGLIGIVLILAIAFLFSNNKRRINKRLVISGLILQIVIAILVLRVPPVKSFFQLMGKGMQHIEAFGREGAAFVYGGIATDNEVYNPRVLRADTVEANGVKTISNYIIYGQQKDSLLPMLAYQTDTKQVNYRYTLVTFDAKTQEMNGHQTIAFVKGVPKVRSDFSQNGFVFAFNITATIILVSILVALLYHIGLMQRIVAVIAKAMNTIMRVSGAEALSNVASAFVGQVEAQMMIKPYLKGMTKSELLASMSGSLACIAGGILVVYTTMGAQAEYLIAASLMAAPGALVISKIVYPETEISETMGSVKLDVKKEHVNVIDAISHGAGDGFKVSMNVIAMLIGFLALIAMVNFLLGMINPALTLDAIFSKVFYPMAWSMGVPVADVSNVATLFGQKLTINEFVAFKNLTSDATTIPIVSEKGRLIASIAICGFANFSSVGMQIGGIGALAPERRADLARLGMRALLCGTLASYLSATIAGILF